jgi:hypothetical protein
MSKRLIEILLLVSLAFNLAVVCMFSYVHFFHKMPFRPDMGRRHEWNRDGRQDREMNKKMQGMMEANRESMKPYREEFRLKREQFMKLLAAEQVNEAQAIKAMQASLAAQDTLESKLGMSLLELRKKMTPAEAKEYFEMRIERMKHRQWGNRRPDDNPPDNNNPKGDKP